MNDGREILLDQKYSGHEKKTNLLNIFSVLKNKNKNYDYWNNLYDDNAHIIADTGGILHALDTLYRTLYQ